MKSALRDDPPEELSAELHDLLTDGCARTLTLETEKLRVSRRISELAVDAHNPDAASELRRLWARRRELAQELIEVRGLLRQLGGPRRQALA
jgi:hypothetical protein